MSIDQQSESEKPSNKAVAKIAAAMVAAFIFVPTFVAVLNNHPDIGGFFSIKLITGLAGFPVLFFLIKYFYKPKKDKAFGQKIDISDEADRIPKKISKWNYVGVVLGSLALAFIFVPDFVAGKAGGTFFMGAIFWIVVIFFSLKNILGKGKI